LRIRYSDITSSQLSREQILQHFVHCDQPGLYGENVGDNVMEVYAQLLKRLLTACAASCAVVATAAFAQAGVIVQSQGVMTVAPVDADTTTGAFSINYALQNASTRVLVVGTYMDNNGTSGETAAANGIRYNGVLADKTISSARTTLSYWSILPGSTGTYQLTGTAAAGVATGETVGYYAWELSNVDLGLGVDQAIISAAGATTASVVGSITTTSANRLVTDFYGANKQDNNNVVPAVGPPASITTGATALLLPATSLNTTTGVVAGGTGLTFASGSYTLGWNGTGTSNSTRELAFAFASAVPEPSSLMLLVGGVLMLAGRRRSMSL
jgi:hypothetical protein